MILLRLCPFLILIFIGELQAAELQLASIFSDGVVVQRNQLIPVWGQGEPNATVAIDFDQQHAQATVDAEGWWRADLPARAAGGPYALSVSSAGKTASVRDVLCGDVWLCSGQSNMQMTIDECAGGEQAAAESVNYPRLRLLSINRGGADQPQRTFQRTPIASWKPATPEAVAKFTAVGYFFAQSLLADPALKDVPIGLIDSSVGGTVVEAWTPLDKPAAEPRAKPAFNVGPGSLYNAMIYPLAPAGLSGVLWYQGESNAGKPELYTKLLTTMIEGWRQRWSRSDLPFFIVQLPPFSDKIDGHYYTWLREAQAKVAQSVPRCDLVVTLNTTDGSYLHPRTKLEVGRRTALLAQRDVYGEKIVAQGPVFKDARSDGSRLRVTFDTAGDRLLSRNPERLDGFQLAGEDGNYFFADAAIHGDEVVVESKSVPAPKTVRYAWLGVPTADLVNRDGLPAAPFRTDSLPPTDLEFQPTPVMHRLTTKNIDLVVDERGNVRSLGVGGQQFLSNSFGGSAGTCFPGVFGFPRELSLVEKLQPASLRFSDGLVTIEITADDEQTVWTVTNGDKNEVQFRMTLANGVNAAQKDGVVEMSRFLSRAKVEGTTELQKQGPDGQPLMTAIPAQGKAVLRIVHQH